MTPKRPKTLKWIGNELPDGRPERFLEFVPPRDLTEEETDALTQDQLAIIRQHDDLYKEIHAPETKKSSSKPPTSSSGGSSSSSSTPPASSSSNTSSTAADPATEAENG